ncbi:MAG: chromosome segregation protein SMC, partial [Spartobacteria bacterium]|nr:chromosome segregation protein SMC [Spartobacteria bacterium]
SASGASKDVLSSKEKCYFPFKIYRSVRNSEKRRLISEQIKKRTDQSMDTLQIELQTLTAKLAEMGEHIGALKQQLKNNEESKKTFQEKRKAIEKQQCECIRWNRLHELIGSAEGKKFRNYAQGLTFELLVHHANQQLAKLTDRYLLLRSDSESLELKVMDNYQDVTRSTKNLSGGESFIVSLSLALGLSKMASHKVRVDSLFLDEGFGTLDEDALETALDTLAGLQQEGKLIGVISHVSALKERINTQINVIPVTGGRSALEGPGVSGSSS